MMDEAYMLDEAYMMDPSWWQLPEIDASRLLPKPLFLVLRLQNCNYSHVKS